MGVKTHLVLPLRRQIFRYVRELFYGHALEYLEPTRSEKKKWENGFFLPKRLTVTDRFEGAWLVGTRYRR